MLKHHNAGSARAFARGSQGVVENSRFPRYDTVNMRRLLQASIGEWPALRSLFGGWLLTMPKVRVEACGASKKNKREMKLAHQANLLVRHNAQWGFWEVRRLLSGGEPGATLWAAKKSGVPGWHTA